MRMVLPLRRINSTLRIGLPFDYVQQRGLLEGDQVIWIEDEVGVRIKIVRVADAPEVPVIPQEAAAE